MDPQAYVAIENMEIDEIQGPILYQTREGKEGYRLIKLIKKIDPHRANLQDDYQVLKEATEQKAKHDATLEWIKKKIAETYIFIDDKYRACDWELDWNKQQN